MKQVFHVEYLISVLQSPVAVMGKDDAYFTYFPTAQDLLKCQTKAFKFINWENCENNHTRLHSLIWCPLQMSNVIIPSLNPAHRLCQHCFTPHC